MPARPPRPALSVTAPVTAPVIDPAISPPLTVRTSSLTRSRRNPCNHVRRIGHDLRYRPGHSRYRLDQADTLPGEHRHLLEVTGGRRNRHEAREFVQVKLHPHQVEVTDHRLIAGVGRDLADSVLPLRDHPVA